MSTMTNERREMADECEAAAMRAAHPAYALGLKDQAELAVALFALADRLRALPVEGNISMSTMTSKRQVELTRQLGKYGEDARVVAEVVAEILRVLPVTDERENDAAIDVANINLSSFLR